MPHAGSKIQIFGAVLVCLGATTVLLARTIGFDPDMFYVAFGLTGTALLVDGAAQQKLHYAPRSQQEYQ